MKTKNPLQGDQLVAAIAGGSGDRAANDLLSAFFTGYPVDNLRGLLASPDEAVAKTAAWILSELGVAATPLLDTFAALLVHPVRNVRFFALDAVLLCTTACDGELLATAVQRLGDEDEAVRGKALRLVARASQEQLACSATN